MTPLAIFGIEKALNLWPAGFSGAWYDFHPWIRASWVYMEIGTVIAGPPSRSASSLSRFLPHHSLRALVHVHGCDRAPLSQELDISRAVPHLDRLRCRHAAGQLLHRSPGSRRLRLLGIPVRRLDDPVGRSEPARQRKQLAHFAYGCLNMGFRHHLGPAQPTGISGLRRDWRLSPLSGRARAQFPPPRFAVLPICAVSLLGVAIIALGIFLQKQMPRIKSFVDANLSNSVARMLPQSGEPDSSCSIKQTSLTAGRENPDPLSNIFSEVVAAIDSLPCRRSISSRRR